MRNLFSATFVFILSLVQLSAQDSLVTTKNLYFTSPLEEKLFGQLTASGYSEKELFGLFISCGSAVDEKFMNASWQSFEQQLPQLQQICQKEKKNDRRIRAIYDYVHSTFLTKYEEQNKFKEIFTVGNYNCVSATALYAFYFERLGIPYSIKEIPSHVYLIAYPNTDQIKVESTSPQNGITTINESFKQGFVKMLKDNKVISQQEYTVSSVDALFNTFYFKENKDITLQQLASIQYTNSAFYLHEDGRHEEAFQQTKKAYYLFKSERSLYLMAKTGIDAFTAHPARDEEQAHLLASISQLAPFGIEWDMIKAEFAKVVSELLFTNNKQNELDSYYQILMKEIKQDKLRNELDFIYQYECGRYYYNQGKNKVAKVYWEKGLSLKPTDADMLSIFTSLLARTYSIDSDFLAFISEAERYGAVYPKLRENNNYNTLLVNAYAVQFGIFFDMNNAVDGDKYRLLFEGLLTKYPDVELISNVIGRSYSNAAVYYFRRGQTAKAKSLLDKGLAISPGNYELMRRKEMIK